MERIVVVGSSSGGLAALRTIVAGLPPDFPCAIVLVQHIGAHRSILPEILSGIGTLPAAHAQHRDALVPGRIYVAPPDRHLLIEERRLILSAGAKEHFTRPAIDPLFRSAAIEFGAGAIGVLLTGYGDDGTAGLQAIKLCGGTAIVQDPTTAESPAMPASALAYADVDHCMVLATMPSLLTSLAGQPVRARPTTAPEKLRMEVDMVLGRGSAMDQLRQLGRPSTFVCPSCNGGLWEMTGTQPLRLRCHTGHAFSLASLQASQSETTDTALWNALRALEEEEMLLRGLSRQRRDEGRHEEEARLQEAAAGIAQQCRVVRELVEDRPTPIPE